MATPKKLFISYRRKSWGYARQLRENLAELLNAEIFMDFASIDQDEFEAAILHHLRTSDVVLVVVTEYTFDPTRIHRPDDWVRREIREALQLNKPIALACFDGLFPPNDLPYDIQPIRNKEGKRLFAEFFEAGCKLLASHIATIGEIPFRTSTTSSTRSTRNLDSVSPPKPNFTFYQQHLIDIMLDWKQYEPIQRADASRQLIEFDDPRPGVGLNSDGIPDIAWCKVLGGNAKLGGDKDAHQWLPEQIVNLPTYYIAKYPVTYLQFQAFLDAEDGFVNNFWWQGLAEQQTEIANQRFEYKNHPRENVSWYEAIAFCRWLSNRLGYEVTLPTEQQWEKTARSSDGRFFPWGNRYESGYANIDETEENNKVGKYYLGMTTAVGLYPQGKSPYEVMDLCGNIWEWTLSEWESGKGNLSSRNFRVLKGGSWGRGSQFIRAAYRGKFDPSARNNFVGFRVVSQEPQ